METIFNSLEMHLIQNKKTFFLGNDKISLIFDSYSIGTSLIFLYSDNNYIGYIEQKTIKSDILEKLWECSVTDWEK